MTEYNPKKHVFQHDSNFYGHYLLMKE